MDKNNFAPTPPMGWNSYDYYDTTVNEQQVKANADYMAKHLKDSGWEYIVVDIEWYSYNVGTKRDEYQYIPFEKVEIDNYSRLLPCPKRFPSSTDGKGFKPLADYIHGLGLKFGIHIMRGIPRDAAHKMNGILNSRNRANDIADPSNICCWNPDMYGLFPNKMGAAEYYDSIFQLYSDWGVDFVKCDDICRMDMPSAKLEIEMMHNSIQKTGRKIVFSLSPGPAKNNEAWHYEKYANMWRITDDFWDSWPLLLNMFDRCELWQNQVSKGCYPDCDMLPVGSLGKGFNCERDTNFTKDEQITMLTLWVIFRSPLMIGGELTTLDEWTLNLLTNKDVLLLLKKSVNAKQYYRNNEYAIWTSNSSDNYNIYIAVFNLTDKKMVVGSKLKEFKLEGCNLKELWENKSVLLNELQISPHGAKLLAVANKSGFLQV